jgi:hypothetical protein
MICASFSLFGSCLVKFGASDKAYFSGKEIPVEIGEGERLAVRGYKKLGTVKVGSWTGNERELDRPVAEFGFLSHGVFPSSSQASRLFASVPCHASGASTGERSAAWTLLCRHFGHLPCIIVFGGFSHLKRDGAPRAFSVKVTKAVTVTVAYKFRLRSLSLSTLVHASAQVSIRPFDSTI